MYLECYFEADATRAPALLRYVCIRSYKRLRKALHARKRSAASPIIQFIRKLAQGNNSEIKTVHKLCIIKYLERNFNTSRFTEKDTKMSENKQLQAGQELIKKSMDELIQQRQTTEKVTIQARQEFREHFQSSYEEEFEEETFTDEFGNETTKRVESSSESSQHSKSADVKVKATGLNEEQVKALTDCANQAGQLALDSKAAN